MTTTLTNDGWTGDSTGVWTQNADIVDGLTGSVGIKVELGTVANTLAGDDSLIGSGETYGIDNYGSIDTGNGNDSLTGSGGTYGISNEEGGSINTGNGDDTITGSGLVGIFNNSNSIDTGNGNDTITGSGSVIGINNFGSINTGSGNDIVDALTGGFDGGGLIDLGDGNDLIKGRTPGRKKHPKPGAPSAPDDQNVDGGKGFDTAELGAAFDQSILSIPTNGYDIGIGWMCYKNVESFKFTDQTLTLADLKTLVPQPPIA